jgi:hypothetical protein
MAKIIEFKPVLTDGHTTSLADTLQALGDATTKFAQKQNEINNVFVRRVNQLQKEVLICKILLLIVGFLMFMIFMAVK